MLQVDPPFSSVKVHPFFHGKFPRPPPKKKKKQKVGTQATLRFCLKKSMIGKSSVNILYRVSGWVRDCNYRVISPIYET